MHLTKKNILFKKSKVFIALFTKNVFNTIIIFYFLWFCFSCIRRLLRLSEMFKTGGVNNRWLVEFEAGRFNGSVWSWFVVFLAVFIDVPFNKLDWTLFVVFKACWRWTCWFKKLFGWFIKLVSKSINFDSVSGCIYICLFLFKVVWISLFFLENNEPLIGMHDFFFFSFLKYSPQPHLLYLSYIWNLVLFLKVDYLKLNLLLFLSFYNFFLI